MALPHVVAAFKRSDTNAEKEEFKTYMEKCRVVNKNYIGVLKPR